MPQDKRLLNRHRVIAMDLTLLSNLLDSAKKVYPNSVLMQKVVVTQAILESGFLNRNGGSLLAHKYNNLFGIKGYGTSGRVLLPTWEHLNGRDVQVKDWFASNATQEDSFKQHKTLMDRPRYEPVRDAPTPKEAFIQLQKCGYATDVAYPQKLFSIYSAIVMGKFD